MICPSPIASAPPVRRLLLPAVAALLLTAGAPVALAQQPAPAPAPAQKPAAKPAQKPATAQKPAAPAAPAQPAQGQAAPQGQEQAQQPQLIYSPWAKFCGKGNHSSASRPGSASSTW